MCGRMRQTYASPTGRSGGCAAEPALHGDGPGRTAPGQSTVKAYSLLFGVPSPLFAYPEPQ